MKIEQLGAILRKAEHSRENVQFVGGNGQRKSVSGIALLGEIT
jgi:hypothetical protein